MKKGLISLLFLLSCGVWDAAAQDLIVKKDGTNVEAKVLEIGEKDIKYKKASHLDGPTYLVSVANVVYIRFEDGSTDIFSQEDYDRLAAEAKNPTPQKQPKRSAPSAFAGRYQPGDYFDENGVRGIVIEVDAEGHGIVMSIAQANLRWCEFKKSDAVRLGLDDQHDGAVNQAAFARMADEGKVRWEDYPAFKWCRDLGEGWYLPAINEVLLQQRPHKVRPQGPRTVQQPAERARRSEDGPADVLFLLDRRRRRMDGHDDPHGNRAAFRRTDVEEHFVPRPGHAQILRPDGSSRRRNSDDTPKPTPVATVCGRGESLNFILRFPAPA